ncbi:unnamed protein product [Rotaria sp. Silwood1]|nr:unnamed protein product [Rotaria sp. Silwood1]CAF0772808.1 unnamed protein product [Rotaria sp. Silwood1]CAF3322390.1 unnamed protein product [Rotaria sp. Silwood1]CAF3339497.1 unnamed protein product [Rotaria sp. Silwood1]CAF3343992.1 unnamed protein product [Rotaria sp. Silwood1]
MKLFFVFITIGLVLMCLISMSEQATHINILGRGIGNSGKPRQNFIHKNNRKKAQEAARRQDSGRSPIHHNAHGKKPHFYLSNKHVNTRKDGSHFQYGKKKNG